MTGTSAAAPRRSTLLALLGACGAAAWLGSQAFVGARLPPRARGERVVAGVGAGYLTRNGPKDIDEPYDAREATGMMRKTVFRKRPFGILRYAPGEDGIGAMAVEVAPRARYPGDPTGQAAAAGVKGGMVVRAINGIDMRGVSFEKIMDILDDETGDVRFAKHTEQAVQDQGGPLLDSSDLPLTVTFAEIPGYQYKGGEMIWDESEGWILDPELTIKDRVKKAVYMLGRLTKEDAEKMAEIVQLPELEALVEGAKVRGIN